ncbi:MAG: hypothetical protein NXH81_08420 [Halieaceae bacterium]|uniref:hypothetical protein n=1 Tax=Haliea alexandrii TaxID=2448162 RepID=UPI000F0B0376|nr:hypothetical protein [Haliea alexandrii]MCR9185405.1 hypothetical protein [Halieaceae bacterium]
MVRKPRVHSAPTTGSNAPEFTPGSERPTPAALASAFAALGEEPLAPPLGFSARLNLLLDLAAVVPARIEGRVLGVLAINPAWKELEVRRWLQQDQLPDRAELRRLVKLLVAQLGPEHDALRWEAFLVYGSPIVGSPVEHLLYREDRGRRDIASRIFALLTEQYAIPPSSYDADLVFQRCLKLMQQFNVYEWEDFQAGHMEPFRSVLFPESS